MFFGQGRGVVDPVKISISFSLITVQDWLLFLISRVCIYRSQKFEEAGLPWDDDVADV